MLGAMDEKVRHFLVIVRRKGGVVNTVIANATARALIERSNEEHLKYRFWTFFLGKEFNQKDGASQTCLYNIKAWNSWESKKWNWASFPASNRELCWAVLYSPVTHSQFRPNTSKHTLSPKGSKHVAIAGSSFKQALTATCNSFTRERVKEAFPEWNFVVLFR